MHLEALEAGKQTERLGQKTDQAGAKIDSFSQKIKAAQKANGDVAESLKEAASAADQVGKAKLDAAKAAEAVARATGDEAGAQEAANLVRQIGIDLARQKADFDAAAVAIAQQNLELLRSEIKTESDLTAEKSAAITTAARELEVKRAQALASRAAVQQAEAEGSSVARLAAIRRAANSESLADERALLEIRRRTMDERQLRRSLEQEVAQEIERAGQLAAAGNAEEAKAAIAAGSTSNCGAPCAPISGAPESAIIPCIASAMFLPFQF
jgi:hypothetical protein